jgi:hypothetical protein
MTSDLAVLQVATSCLAWVSEMIRRSGKNAAIM